jgi:hypothetical protein
VLIRYSFAFIAEKQLAGIHLVTDQQPVSTEYLLKTIGQYLNRRVYLVKVPTFILSLIKIIRPKEYAKVFGTLSIETNFRFEELIKRKNVEQGIQEMVQWYKYQKHQ